MERLTIMKKKMKNSLWLQLMAFAAIIGLFLLSALLVTDRYIGEIRKENTLKLNQQVLNQVTGKVDVFYDTMNHVATSLAYSPTTYDYFNQDSLNRVISLDDMASVFSNTVRLEDDIAGIYLYDMNMNRIASMGTEMDSENIARVIKENLEYSGMFYLRQIGVPYYSIYFPVYDLKSRQYGKQIGMCVFVMRTDNFGEFLGDVKVTDHTQIYLIDGNNKVLVTGEREKSEELDESELESTDDFYVSVKAVKMTGWRVISRVPQNELKSDVGQSMAAVLISYAIAFVLLGFLVYFCYRRIVHPIQKVDGFIKQVVSKPEARMNVERNDEIGNVIISLNQMLDEKELMDSKVQESQKRVYEAELAKKQLQVLAYRNQINPHFLYNTFECIRAMALYYDADEIAEITMALSKVFRFAVKGDNIVTVEEEVNYIKEYAKIIDYRFMGKIEINLDIDEEVKSKNVIKLMLQPLVENAVFHGVEQKMNGGEVDVSIHMKNPDEMILTVEDNGLGIEPKKLKELQETLGTSESQKGVGMANIYQRIKLFYGEDTTFDIQSEEGVGTKITIIVSANIQKEVRGKEVE